MRVRLSQLCFLVLALATSVAGAVSKKDKAEAKKHYEAGTKHFDAREYDAAAMEYSAAHELTGDPALLFNIGQAYRLGGHNAEAIKAYDGFLDESTKLPRKKRDAGVEQEVREHIGELEAAVEAEQQAAVAAEQKRKDDEARRAARPKPRPRPAINKTVKHTDTPLPLAETRSDGPRPIYKKWWFWTGLAVVAAGGVAIAVIATRPGSKDELPGIGPGALRLGAAF